MGVLAGEAGGAGAGAEAVLCQLSIYLPTYRLSSKFILHCSSVRMEMPLQEFLFASRPMSGEGGGGVDTAERRGFPLWLSRLVGEAAGEPAFSCY